MYVIHYTNLHNIHRGWVGSVEDVTDRPDHARKFSTPSDAECWMESHPMSEGFASAGYSREVVAVGEAETGAADDDPPAPDSEVIVATLNGSDKAGEG